MLEISISFIVTRKEKEQEKDPNETLPIRNNPP